MDNVALITGADRGLGLALTKALLDRGWTVLAGRFLDWPELSSLESAHHGKLKILDLDVSSDESVRLAAQSAAHHVGKIDVLICNAAIQMSSHVESIRDDLNFDHMRKEFDINTLGALRVTKEFLPLLESSPMKRICFVSSEAGSIGESQRTGWFGYCMSKAALNMAVKNLHNDLAPRGFGIRLYHPGWMRTYMSGEKNLEAHYEPDEAAQFALAHFLSETTGPELRLVDWQGREMLW
jgi:NAD(P)-dependent dehydrogenase (short-subunit alcohol dehydrogenase family)